MIRAVATLLAVLAPAAADAAPGATPEAESPPICTADSPTAVPAALLLTDRRLQTGADGEPGRVGFTLVNQTGNKVVLIGAASPGCDGLAMQPPGPVTIPGHRSVVFGPGGHGLACRLSASARTPGERVLVTLRFQDGRHLGALFSVVGAPAP